MLGRYLHELVNPPYASISTRIMPSLIAIGCVQFRRVTPQIECKFVSSATRDQCLGLVPSLRFRALSTTRRMLRISRVTASRWVPIQLVSSACVCAGRTQCRRCAALLRAEAKQFAIDARTDIQRAQFEHLFYQTARGQSELAREPDTRGRRQAVHEIAATLCREHDFRAHHYARRPRWQTPDSRLTCFPARSSSKKNREGLRLLHIVRAA